MGGIGFGRDGGMGLMDFVPYSTFSSDGIRLNRLDGRDSFVFLDPCSVEVGFTGIEVA